jgi:hypothetical protein
MSKKSLVERRNLQSDQLILRLKEQHKESLHKTIIEESKKRIDSDKRLAEFRSFVELHKNYPELEFRKLSEHPQFSVKREGEDLAIETADFLHKFDDKATSKLRQIRSELEELLFENKKFAIIHLAVNTDDNFDANVQTEAVKELLESKGEGNFKSPELEKLGIDYVSIKNSETELQVNAATRRNYCDDSEALRDQLQKTIIKKESQTNKKHKGKSWLLIDMASVDKVSELLPELHDYEELESKVFSRIILLGAFDPESGKRNCYEFPKKVSLASVFIYTGALLPLIVVFIVNLSKLQVKFSFTYISGIFIVILGLWVIQNQLRRYFATNKD